MKKILENIEIWAIGIVIVLAILGAILGIRILWAKLVYHDMRCAFAECRIQVNPN